MTSLWVRLGADAFRSGVPIEAGQSLSCDSATDWADGWWAARMVQAERDERAELSKKLYSRPLSQADRYCSQTGSPYD